MKDLWKDLNGRIPEYFKSIITKYSLKVIKISRLETALVSDSYVLIIEIDRFNADITYITRDERNKLVKYNCNNFFAEKYDEDDRHHLLNGDTANERISNDLIIISHGLESKWSNVLSGDKDWIRVFEKSQWFGISRLKSDELLFEELLVKNEKNQKD
ncbi:hypothetical protein [Listeria booriae]|uniref:hypothetical protein n=1 Tax=Listeria booriae TaxID=1552123 RepID=UPI001624BF5A|nr:hypothetical protein [Listeria booriae]MBC2196137.1 hypothetical protein [Listeria booriae]